MPAIFFITLLTAIMGIMGAIISGMSSSSAQLKANYIAETRTYFDSVRQVVLSDITPQNMHANIAGGTDIVAYLRATPQIQQLASGRTGDAATDAWGRTLKGYIVTENQALQANVIAPVTAIALVSAGPDGVFQTKITAATTINQVTSLAVPAGSDDILISFTNRGAQEQILAGMEAAMRRIGSAAVKELQGRLAAHREKQLASYQKQIKDGGSPNISMLDVSLDTTAPKFIALNNTKNGIANRRALGIDNDFDTLQRVLPNKGSLQVIATAPTTSKAPLVLQLQNATKPSPWPTVNYQIRVTALN